MKNSISLMMFCVLIFFPLSAFGQESTKVGDSPKSTAAADDSSAIIESMQSYYDKARSFSADFRQVYETVDGIESKSSGVVWFKKPGMMRWDYKKPESRFLISDGSTFWSWEPKYRQYCEQSLESSQLPTALSFLTGEGRLAEDFEGRVSSVKGSRVRLKLVPKVPTTAYSELEFEVMMPQASVRSVRIKDSMGNMNLLEFVSPELNGAMDETLFKFTAPKDAKEICQ